MAADQRATEGLPAELRRLAEQAKAVAGNPLRANAENLAGYVESVALDPRGGLWAMGWLRRDLPLELPLLLAERGRHPAALSAIGFERPDLPADARGFIGLLATAWRPGGEPGDLFLFAVPELALFLRAPKPLPLLPFREVMAAFTTRAPDSAGRVEALRQVLLGNADWLPHGPQAGFAAMAHVDQLLALPGFGCIAEGWAMSPARPLADVALRLGRKVLNAVPGTLQRLPRPDCATVEGHTPRLLETAGFVVALEGDLAAEDLTHPMLKLRFADGAAANFPAGPETLRRLDHAVPLDQLLRFYPGLEDEPFFPRLAAALRADLAERLAPAHCLVAGDPAPHCLVAALPSQAGDTTLLADALARALMAAPGTPPAVLLLADAGADRARLPLLARAMAEATGRRCATWLVERADKPLWALPRVLAGAGCDRFLLLAPDCFPDEAGWAAALAALADDEPAPRALAAEGALAALAWDRSGLAAWLAAHPPALGRAHLGALLALAVPLEGGARRATAPPGGEKVLDLVDALEGLA